VAIGEIGLDTKIDTPDLDIQLPVLEAQLQLAVDLDLPVILHCRGAFDELLDAVNNHGGKLRGVLHAFSRSREVADRFLAAGLHLGLGGAVTRPNARKVRRAAAELPLDRIVLETDAPSIGLDGVMPQDTEPQHVTDVARALAELRGITVEEVALATTATAGGLFRVL
jgi:TatD DNase family protein